MRTERAPDGRVWTIVEHLDETPTSFPSERAEAEWWDTHDFSDEVRAQLAARPLPDQLRPLIPALR